MSILTKLTQLEERRSLLRFVPKGDDKEIRTLFLEPNVHERLYRSYKSKTEMDVHAAIRSFLNRFVLGAEWQDGEDIKLLCPLDQGIWELRVRFRPQARVIGCFAQYNTFVGLGLYWRDNLGAAKDKRWKRATEKADELWINLFQTDDRLRRPNIEGVISGGLPK